MPVTKTAKRALRVSTVKKSVNAKIRTALEIAVKTMRLKPTEVNLKKVFSAADTAVKKDVIHENKASRIKSSASKLISK